MYIPKLTGLKFYLHRSISSDIDPSYISYLADPSAVKKYFKEMGFANTDGRTYMAHTGNPHVNLEDRHGNTVQISWWTKMGRPVGVSFLTSIRKELAANDL